MYLKEIEMQGFKSFADKTKVEFDRGVTAVVGPNGSGKSNITESLRWALGESSAKSLRGGKMPDVIFAGTESRKPLNYAYVAVTLDNSDQFIATQDKDVRVERRIFRSGDSEYLIDGRKVRLRDVHELFMDTGLGRDSFSIISQGRVEAIFNSKPEERRAIFEEAAGVLKYKTRKRETQTKLNQTQDNLDRLEDIIYELDGQLQPLAKQAEIAKTFLGLEEERKTLDLALLVADIGQKKLRLDQAQADLADIKEQLASYYDERKRLEDKNQKLKDKRHGLSDDLSKKQAELLEVTRLLSDLEGQIELSKLEASQSTKQKAQLQADLNDLQDRQANLEKEVADKADLLDTLTEQLTLSKTDIKRLEEALAQYANNPDQVIEQLREQFVGLLQEEAELSNRLTVLKTERANQEQLNQTQAREVAKLEEERSSLQVQLASSQEALVDAKGLVEDLLQAYQKQAVQVKKLDEQYRKAQTALFDQMDDIKSKEARRASLEAIYKNHSNFYAGVKAVLQATDRLSGIVGAVSEHLTFDKRYQTALEIALGGSSQHIIVEDEGAAKAAINFLKNNRRGRATFLPLTTIKPRQLSAQQESTLNQSTGFLGLASHLVSFEPRLANIMHNLLGVTAIFDTIDHANQAAKALAYKVRLVTLDGTEIRPGGSFSGGASRQNNTTFIKPELDELTQELKTLNEEQLALEKSAAIFQKDYQEAAAHLEQVKAEGEEARLKEQAASLAYQQLAERLADVEASYDLLAHQRHQATGETLSQQQADVEQALSQLAEKKAELSRQIEQIKTDKDSLEQKVAQLTDELSQAQLREREQASELKFERANYQRLTEDLDKSRADGERLAQALSHHGQELDSKTLPRLQKQAEQAREHKEGLEGHLVSLRFELEDCEAQLEELEQQLTKESQKNETFIRQQAQIEAQIEQLSNQLRHFARRLSEDYQMTLEEAKEEATTLDNMDLARENLQAILRRIKALGPVNVDAIAQFEEVSQRLTFLNSQKDDLVHAKNLLLDTISDMDGEVKQRFKATFEAIRDSFRQTFKQMFGGGQADLLLTSDNLLEAGIDISVQPPGKKIQSLNLMSGGEKALSALALLFAIIRVKTIPFVILDEVEAALDEANVKRFGDYLNRFDKSSQFIVVTHRKGTMAAADAMYGVTMQESGVSKIVSVKLKDLEGSDDYDD